MSTIVTVGTDTGEMVLSYKLGIKGQIENALRKAFATTYPDIQLSNKVSIISEYPLSEISFPVIVIKYTPGDIKNAGIGHYEISQEEESEPGKLLRWKFHGTVTFEVYGKTPLDRDLLITGMTNLFAFGSQIPGFEEFQLATANGDYIILTLGMQSFQETGDNLGTIPWGDAPVEKAYMDALTVGAFGEFYTEPSTGSLVEIKRVNLFPYLPSQPVPNINV